MEKNVKISLLLDTYGRLLTEKQFNLLDDYYNNDFSLSEIAENEGITRQAVRDNLMKGENNLLEYDEKLKLLDKNRDNSKLIDDAITELEELEKSFDTNSKNGADSKKKCQRIIKTLRKIV